MIYLDTSALLKLVLPEEHAEAFAAYVAEREDAAVSSILTVIETRRAVLRESPSDLPRADLALSRVGKIDLAPAVVEAASRLPDRTLRSLDAIHVASALLLGSEVSAFVTYDKRLLAAATAQGLPAVRPT